MTDSPPAQSTGTSLSPATQTPSSTASALAWATALEPQLDLSLELTVVKLSAIAAGRQHTTDAADGTAVVEWSAWTAPAVQLLALLAPIVVQRPAAQGGRMTLVAGARTWAMLWQRLGADAQVPVLVLTLKRSQRAAVGALLAQLDEVGLRALHRWAAGLSDLRDRHAALACATGASLPMLRDARLETLAQALGCTSAALAKASRSTR